MGAVAPRTIFSNDTGPFAGVGLETLAQNQAAILELEGAQAPQSKTIASGSISPTAAYVIVDTEGSAAADDLDVISPVLSASENLHDGMVLYLKAADSGRVVTVKNSSSANGINTYDGNDYVLSTTHWLKLQLRSGKWYEVEGRAMETALAAAIAAAAASTPATTTLRGIARVATLADMEPGAVVENGPAVLAAGSEALNALVPTFLIGSIISTYAADGYVPNGCVLPDGAEYTQSQFPSFYTDYLVAGKIVTCTYTEFAAQVALTGNCGKFALDTVNQKFRVPLLKDGDSITHAASASEIGKSVEAGLPNLNGSLSTWTAGIYGLLRDDAVLTPPFYRGDSVPGGTSGAGGTGYSLGFNAQLSNPIYGNSTTVTDEQVRLRHFVVLASAQNNSSMFDWSNYMAALAGKLNSDLSNKPTNLIYVTSTWNNGAGTWYRKWSDGWIEQGGLVSGGQTSITFNTPFSDTKYTFQVYATGIDNGDSSHSATPTNSRTTTTITIWIAQYNNAGGPSERYQHNWIAKGF